MDPSGIRIGTPALTTRGMGPDQFRQIGAWIIQALKNAGDESVLNGLREEVRQMAVQFPVPANAVATAV
jgi:glycine hydroxymethyltransferase